MNKRLLNSKIKYGILLTFSKAQAVLNHRDFLATVLISTFIVTMGIMEEFLNVKILCSEKNNSQETNE
jgi:hypothetical protein